MLLLFLTMQWGNCVCLRAFCLLYSPFEGPWTHVRTHEQPLGSMRVYASEWSLREKPFFWDPIFFSFFVLTFISQPVTQIWEFRRPLEERVVGGRFPLVEYWLKFYRVSFAIEIRTALRNTEDITESCSTFHQISHNFVTETNKKITNYG